MNHDPKRPPFKVSRRPGRGLSTPSCQWKLSGFHEVLLKVSGRPAVGSFYAHFNNAADSVIFKFQRCFLTLTALQRYYGGYTPEWLNRTGQSGNAFGDAVGSFNRSWVASHRGVHGQNERQYRTYKSLGCEVFYPHPLPCPFALRTLPFSRSGIASLALFRDLASISRRSLLTFRSIVTILAMRLSAYAVTLSLAVFVCARPQRLRRADFTLQNGQDAIALK